MNNANILKTDSGAVVQYAWPGGYPVFYITADSGVLCPTCVQENLALCTDDPEDKQWHVVAHAANWEDPTLYCDNCNKRIESAYAEVDTCPVVDGVQS